MIDQGRAVSGTGIPAGAYVGTVTNSFVNAIAPSSAGGFVITGSFALVNASGQPLADHHCGQRDHTRGRDATDRPAVRRHHATTGGGDTGSVLISPYIKPGSVSKRFYNHYSWLRTMEDLFVVSRKSKGLDGSGHIGYAAQPGTGSIRTRRVHRPQRQAPVQAQDRVSRARPLVAASVLAALLGGCGGSAGHRSTTQSASSTTPAATAERDAAGGRSRKAPLRRGLREDPVVAAERRTAPPARAELERLHPVLTLQGESLSISLSGARLLVTAVGPAVPEIGRTPVPATSPVTFTVTLHARHRARLTPSLDVGACRREPPDSPSSRDRA